MVQRGRLQVIDFLYCAIWHMDCSPPEASGWGGDDLDDAPGQRVTGQSRIDQNSSRSCTPRNPVYAMEPARL
jgi:hypothetical protein